MISTISFKQVLKDRYTGNKKVIVIWNYDSRLLKKFFRDLEETYKIQLKYSNLNEIVEVVILPEFDLKEIEKQLQRVRCSYEIFR